MLHHHSEKDYEEAASSAAKAAKEKLLQMIANGKTNAERVVQQVFEQVPEDITIKGGDVTFETVATEVIGKDGKTEQVYEVVADLHRKEGVDRRPLHKNAFSQIREKLHVPAAWSGFLKGEGQWGAEMLARDMTEVAHRLNGRYLTRSVKGEVRGWLSDQYRRLDSRPLLESFVQNAQEMGLVPVEGYALDTKVAVKALLPMVFEPAPHEVIAFGMKWGNSDYGDGKHNLHVFIVRLWCTNYAIAEDALSQVHLGGRLPEDIKLSEQTYQLDTKTSASAMKDLVSTMLAPERVKAYLDAVKDCHTRKIDPRHAFADLKKRLDKADAEKVIAAFESPDTHNMPEGNTQWRLSNAVSWIAGHTEDRNKGLDMMRYAGELAKLPSFRNVAALPQQTGN